MTYWYLDSSVAMHALLPWGDERAGAWFDAQSDRGVCYSSALLGLETVRALRREQLDVTLAARVLDRVGLIDIGRDVLAAAGSIEPHIKSLDAIHLATCSLLGPSAVVVSHDRTMRQVAAQLDIATIDPLEDVA